MQIFLATEIQFYAGNSIHIVKNLQPLEFKLNSQFDFGKTMSSAMHKIHY